MNFLANPIFAKGLDISLSLLKIIHVVWPNSRFLKILKCRRKHKIWKVWKGLYTGNVRKCTSVNWLLPMWAFSCLAWDLYRSVYMWSKRSADITLGFLPITPCICWAPGRNYALWGPTFQPHVLTVSPSRPTFLQEWFPTGSDSPKWDFMGSNLIQRYWVKHSSTDFPMAGLLSAFKMLLCVLTLRKAMRKQCIPYLFDPRILYLKEHLIRSMFYLKTFCK